MQQYTYLAINFFTIIICFLFSFHKKIKFNKHFLAFITSSSLVALFFIIWDIWFTAKGVWWFNEKYLIKYYISELPIEEVLFFICIPFSCVFTYYCLDQFFKLDWKPTIENIFVIISSVVYMILALIFNDKIYSLITFSTTAVTLIVLRFVLKVSWIGKASFIYLILMPGFFAVNGVLTGSGLESPIVNYNPLHFIGFRIGTIPIEDLFYGYEMILWNLFFFLKLKKTE